MTDWAEDEFKMDWQPMPGKEAQAQGGLPGVQEGEKQPVLWFPAWRGCLSRRWEMSWPDFEGSSVGWEQG